MQPYGFEQIGSDLELMPLAARRAADRAGLKPSLESWRSLTKKMRELLCILGSQPTVDVGQVAETLAGAVPPPESVPASEEPTVGEPPRELLAALGEERRLRPATWSALTALDRFCLLKLAAKSRSGALAAAYDEIVGSSADAPHLDARGGARMVSVSAKAPSVRRAVANSRVSMNEEAFTRLERADAPKGDVLGTARLAGIMGAKRTSELIPLCHPLSLTRVDLVLELDPTQRAVEIRATVEAFDRTGVEMEALTAASTAALTVYDMLKAFDREMSIGPTQLIEKSGGRSDYRARELESTPPSATPAPTVRESGTVPRAERFAICDYALSCDEVLTQVTRPAAGAAVLFIGVVRNHNAGQAVTSLEYQAYTSMAVKEMARIAEQIEAEVPGVRLAARHRVGALSVGEVAVICAASAPHRDEAFRAGRLLIDRIKESVPVWKREHAGEGAYWVGWEEGTSER